MAVRSESAVLGIGAALVLLPLLAENGARPLLYMRYSDKNGDGARLAEKLGRTIIPMRPSLVALTSDDEDCPAMQGLSLRNVGLTLFSGDKVLYREQGEMLFTHFGVSGPLVLSASAHLPEKVSSCRLEIDLKPGLTAEKLDERLVRGFSENINRDFTNALDALLPQKLIPVVIERSGIPAGLKVNSIRREQRLALRDTIKRFAIRLTARRPVEEAIVTAGGVDVREVNPRTMESKIVSGLYFAGEILDLDACTGGYNLQIAWSTGYAAGRGIPEKEITE